MRSAIEKYRTMKPVNVLYGNKNCFRVSIKMSHDPSNSQMHYEDGNSTILMLWCLWRRDLANFERVQDVPYR